MLTERLRKMQEAAKERWKNVDPDIRMLIVDKIIKPEPAPVEKVVAVKQRPKYMSTIPAKHFIRAMSYIGIEFYKYVPKKVAKVKIPKPKKEQEPNRRAEINPITGKMIYRKGNPGPEKAKIERPPAIYDNDSARKKYGL